MNTKLWTELYKGSERYRKAVDSFKTDMENPSDGYETLSRKMEAFSEESEPWEGFYSGILQAEASFWFQRIDLPEQMIWRNHVSVNPY